MTPRQTIAQLLHRDPAGHKYDFGHVLVLGGAPGMVGAPRLAARAALRSGAGLVTVAATPEICRSLDAGTLEAMTFALPEAAAGQLGAVTKFITDRRVLVLALGPGLGQELAPLVRQIIAHLDLPTVVDGGALAALDPATLSAATGRKLVLTPHAGEFAHLMSGRLPAGRAAAEALATEFAQEYRLTLVLKGPATLVAHPGGAVYRNTTGGPGLATAGTGDVLTGIIAALIGQHVEPGAAAEAGTYLHGLAGDLATAAKTEPGVIASDVIEAIPEALKSCA